MERCGGREEGGVMWEGVWEVGWKVEGCGRTTVREGGKEEGCGRLGGRRRGVEKGRKVEWKCGGGDERRQVKREDRQRIVGRQEEGEECGGREKSERSVGKSSGKWRGVEKARKREKGR